jgi:hypothetical protein
VYTLSRCPAKEASFSTFIFLVILIRYSISEIKSKIKINLKGWSFCGKMTSGKFGFLLIFYTICLWSDSLKSITTVYGAYGNYRVCRSTGDSTAYLTIMIVHTWHQ